MACAGKLTFIEHRSKLGSQFVTPWRDRFVEAFVPPPNPTVLRFHSDSSLTNVGTKSFLRVISAGPF